MENVKDLAYQDYLSGMKYKDIADKHGVSLSAVKSWATREWKKVAEKKLQPNTKKVATKNKKSQPEKSEKRVNELIIQSVNENEELTEKQKLFCICYLQNFNATQAAINAGYEPGSARWIGYELLTKPYIRAEVERLKKLKSSAIMLSEEDVVERYMKIAFADMTDFAEFFIEDVPMIANGKPVMTKDAVTGEPILVLKTVNALRFKDSSLVDGGLICEISQGKDGAKIKLEDRQKALDWLSKYFLMNPMDKHKIDYDNARLVLEERKNSESSELVANGSAYTGLPSRVLGRAYLDINRDIDERRHTFYDFKGGRGSLKSSYCGIKLIDMLMLNPSFCGIAIRQVKDTLKDSVYAQIVWAIDELGLTEQFHCTKNPMEIRRKETGQIIYFRGADDPMKIKSIKPPNGMHIGISWIEEADQLHGAEALRNILQSIMRGGNDITVFRSYNTPISQRHYINVEAREENPARIIHHSHYKDAPPEWLGEKFYELAERLKEVNPKAYAHEYDGEATGTGLNIFENVKERTITDDELRTFDKLYFGLDWGQFPHPNAFAACFFNSNTRQLYIYDEVCCYKTRDEDMAVKIDKYRTVNITADPGGGGDKSIRDFQAWGFRMYPAIKGPGSVEAGIKWLQSLNEIIIDNKRCPNAAEQFLTYEYMKDKEGNPITGYPDEGDDFIDAVRYGLESVWRRRGE